MNNATQKTGSEQFTNSLCRDIGHAWISTTASNFRVCKRSGCKAVQILRCGEWVDIPQSQRKQQSDTLSQSAMPQASSLF